MTTDHPGAETSPLSTSLIIGAGIVALAVAMGIGRFAFTPLLPLMLRDGTINAATGAEWAAGNYLGYLVGALTASRFARDPRRGLSIALPGVVATTLGIALLNGSWVPVGGLLLRTATGIFSAWALVCISSWCLSELVRRHEAHLGAWIYTGVGMGIAGAGLFCWLGGWQPSRWLWIEFGALAAAASFFVLSRIPSRGPSPPPSPASASPEAGASGAAGLWFLVFAYCVSGFGYIVPATFLPAMARELVPDPLVFGLTWPVFGLAAAISVAVASRWMSHWPRRKVWALFQAITAMGTLVPLLHQSLGVLVLSALLVGGSFLVTVMAALQLARELMPHNPTVLLARLTAGFAAGQIAGPVLVRAIGAGRIAGLDAFSLSNALATVLLAGTALWLWKGSSCSGGR